MHKITLTPQQVVEARRAWIESGYLRRDFKSPNDYVAYLEDGATKAPPPIGAREIISSKLPPPAARKPLIPVAASSSRITATATPTRSTSKPKPASIPPPKAAPPPKPAPPRWRVEGFTSEESWSTYCEGVRRGAITPGRDPR